MTGILGGSFNPIHLGHLNIASEIRGACNLKKVLFIPTDRPPHKDHERLLAARHRLNMVKLAIADYPYFECSDLEILKPGFSYSIDTINMLLSKSPGEDYAFIIGADSLLELHTWKRIESLLASCKFIAAGRPGFLMDRGNKNVVLSELGGLLTDKKLLDKITLVNTTAFDISSTQIRERCHKGLPIQKLVPQTVAQYIEKHQLYKE